MDTSSQVAVAAQSTVGCILLVAGVAKLRDRAGVAPLLRAVGLDERLAAVLRRAVPLAELGVGAALLGGWVPRPAGLAATLLCAGFCAVLLLARRRGVAQPCRCFGALDRAASHRLAELRAALLLGVATLGWLLAPAAVPARRDSLPLWLLGVLLAFSTLLALALLSEVAAFRAGLRLRRVGLLPDANTETTP